MADPQDPSSSLTPNRKWALAAATASALLLAYPLRFALIPFVVAGGLAIVATPAVEGLARRMKCRRWVAATVVFILCLALLAGLAWWIKAVVFPDAVELTQSLPEMTRKVFVSAAGSDHARLFGQDISADAVIAEAGAAAKSLLSGRGGIGAVLADGLGIVLLFVLTLSTLCYFLVSGPTLVLSVIWLFPPWLRPPVADVLAQMRPFVFRYVVGMIVVVSMTGVLTWIGTGPLLHIPHAVVLALMAGLLELMPVVGAVASALLLGLAAVSQGSIGVVVGVAVFTLVLRLLIDQVVAPIIYGKASALHPAAILFAFLVGAALYDILGLLLAVPAAATIKVILQAYYDTPESSGANRIALEVPSPVKTVERDGNGSAPGG